MPIITSLLDTDFYLLSMGAAVYENFPNLPVEYEFICRNKDVTFDEEFYHRFGHILAGMDRMTFRGPEIDWLRSLGTFSESYLEFLKGFKFDRSYVRYTVEDGRLNLKVVGNMAQAVLYEVYLLAI